MFNFVCISCKRMQKWSCKASPYFTDEQGTAVIGEVGYAMMVWVRLKQPGIWRSTERRDSSPACFTTERHCRWEGRVRRGLRARRHTHTPPDRDTRSRRGRQPLRTPRGGRTALQNDRQPYTAAFILHHHHHKFITLYTYVSVYRLYTGQYIVHQTYTQGPKLTCKMKGRVIWMIIAISHLSQIVNVCERLNTTQFITE